MPVFFPYGRPARGGNQPMLMIPGPAHVVSPFRPAHHCRCVRDGMPSLMVDPIDFASLYLAKLASRDIAGKPSATP